MSEVSNLISDIKELVLFLQELGVDSLAVDLPDAALPSSPVDSGAKALQPLKFEKSRPPERSPATKAPAEPTKRSVSRISTLPSLKARTDAYSTTRVDMTDRLSHPPTAAVPIEEPVLIDVSPALAETDDTIGSIQTEIGDCTRCALSKLGRKQIVHTSGNFNGELMFIGEAPGADEDEQGFPFVGRAGQLLTKIIEGMGIKRDDVCIGNINRCRPPNNRKPEPDETAACRPFILREIAVVKPKVIVVLGATAAHNLLHVKTPITKLRGHFHDYFGVKVMPTFHPAYLLRNPHKKREVWEDMKLVRDYLNSHHP